MQDTYRGGYLKALLDIKHIIEDRSEGLVWRRVLTKKAIRFVCDLIQAVIDERDLVMRYGSEGVTVMRHPEDGKITIVEKG